MRAALLSGLALLATANLASAQVLASDTLSYTGLLSSNGWIAHSGAGNKALTANGSTVTLDQSAGSGEDCSLVFTAQTATDITYASFTLNVPSGNAVTPGASGLYFFHLKNSASNFRARTGLLTPTTGDYTLALNADSSNLGAGISWPTDLTFNTNYCIVVSWDAATGNSQMWVDPTNQASASVSHAGTFTGDLIEAVALRQASDYTGFITIDNVIAGKTFADVACVNVDNSGATGCDCSAGNPSCFSASAAGAGCPNTAGGGAVLTGTGNAVVSSDTFSMSVTGGTPNVFGLVLSGTSAIAPVYTIPNSAGGLCTSGTTKRSDVYQLDGSGAATMPTFQLATGGGLYGAASGAGFQTYQFWYRDPGGAAGCTTDVAGADFNFSNGWDVTWL